MEKVFVMRGMDTRHPRFYKPDCRSPEASPQTLLAACVNWPDKVDEYQATPGTDNPEQFRKYRFPNRRVHLVQNESHHGGIEFL